MNPESSVARARQLKPFIAEVVSQHAEEAANLFVVRTALLRAARVTLGDLRRGVDDRLEAHLDGLSVAGEDAWPFCEAPLEAPSAGAIFPAAVRSIEDKQHRRLDRLLALAEASPETRVGLLAAFGWLKREQLQGIVVALLASRDPFRRMVGIAACSIHRVDPGLASARQILDASPLVRARALRTAGEIGCEEVLPACAAAIRDDDPDCEFWATRSTVYPGKSRHATRGFDCHRAGTGSSS